MQKRAVAMIICRFFGRLCGKRCGVFGALRLRSGNVWLGWWAGGVDRIPFGFAQGMDGI